ncbi:MAG: pentapeptide repeat-containing protein [Scytonematopsis contorta HA4267-MV1]|jgi:uncharacterized protein YjbI with pentapeptide repeats|nr:pentapeptide repeat-containing protein [Scytonematopsis contorta HA4267-MV1]
MLPASRWLAYLSPSNIRGHQRWLKAGCQGSGRIVLEEINLRGASLAAPELVAAKFVRCDLTDVLIRFGDLTDTELVECICEKALLERSTFNKALIKDCQFVGAALTLAKFVETHLQGGNWSQTNLDRTDWKNAQVISVCFQEANFQGARLHNAKFIGCNLQKANIANMIADEAIFENCDFRYTDFNSLKMKNTVFYKCGFYGCTGTPTIEENCTIIAPDLSEDFDTTVVVKAEKIFELWGLVQLLSYTNTINR